MAVITEKELIFTLEKAERILLLEPPYRSSYSPLGLAKIAAFAKARGKKVTYSRNFIIGDFDLVCVTTCFTTDSKIVIKTLLDWKKSIFSKVTEMRIIVGGIFASLMPDYLMNTVKGIDVFVGCSDVLDNTAPDYSVFPSGDRLMSETMLLFTTRGCPNKCSFCMVPKIEGRCKILKSWKTILEQSDRKDCILFDNNILAFSKGHFSEVVQALNRTGKRVLIDNGVDCQFITDRNAKELASLKYFRNGFRTAFDTMDDDGLYQVAMERVIKFGLKVKGNSYTYVLYNFNDTPQDAYYRARECWKYGSNPYLMRYRPLDALSKSDFVGKHWTPNLIKAFRYWGSTFGYNRGDRMFESWMKSSNLNLTSDDWDKWYYKE